MSLLKTIFFPFKIDLTFFMEFRSIVAVSRVCVLEATIDGLIEMKSCICINQIKWFCGKSCFQSFDGLIFTKCSSLQMIQRHISIYIQRSTSIHFVYRSLTQYVLRLMVDILKGTSDYSKISGYVEITFFW